MSADAGIDPQLDQMWNGTAEDTWAINARPHYLLGMSLHCETSGAVGPIAGGVPEQA